MKYTIPPLKKITMQGSPVDDKPSPSFSPLFCTVHQFYVIAHTIIYGQRNLVLHLECSYLELFQPSSIH